MSETEIKELFTTRVRKSTRTIHSVSDALVNAKFAMSITDPTVWAGGLFVFYHIFAHLEDAKERLNMPDYNSLFVHEILHRKKAFEEDLQHYLGDDWRSTPKSQALENYLEHLQGLERENPTMLMAYVYHLYLGMLSGGQILSKKRKMFGGSTYVDKVTDISEVENILQLKNDFRETMNKIAEKHTEEWRRAFIEESNQVFLMNNLIVDSVDGQHQVLKNILLKASAVALLVMAVVMAYKVHK